MKIYTRKLATMAQRVSLQVREFPRITRASAYGSVDELNALLGIVACHAQTAHDKQPALEALSGESDVLSSFHLTELILAIVQQSQHDLFAIGAELHTSSPHCTVRAC